MLFSRLDYWTTTKKGFEAFGIQAFRSSEIVSLAVINAQVNLDDMVSLTNNQDFLH